MIKVALIGAAGYTAKEFLELITRHEYLELDFIYSLQNKFLPVVDSDPPLVGTIPTVIMLKFN